MNALPIANLSTAATSTASGATALAATGVTGFWLLVTGLAAVMLILMGWRLIPKDEF